MVRLSIDGIWQVFKLQHLTPRNDFCRIAAKNGILIRLVNTLYSLNEATRLASKNGGVSAPQNGFAPRPRSGPLELPNRSDLPLANLGQFDSSKVRLEHPFLSGALEQLQNPTSHSQKSEASCATHLEKQLFGGDKPYTTYTAFKAAKENENFSLWDNEPAHPDVDLPKHHRATSSAGRSSTDRSPKHMDFTSNSHPGGVTQLVSQPEQIRPLLSLLEKEPPSRPVSGQLDHVQNFSGLGKHESILPLLHSYPPKTNGELELLMEEFAGTLSCFFPTMHNNVSLVCLT